MSIIDIIQFIIIAGLIVDSFFTSKIIKDHKECIDLLVKIVKTQSMILTEITKDAESKQDG